jgi:hypothetical protein
MKRNCTFFLSLAGSLPLSLGTLWLSPPAASEEAQILPPPQPIGNCPEKLPTLEADRASIATAVNPSSSGNPSRFNPEPAVPQSATTPDQIAQASPTSEVQQILPAPAPLTVPQIEPPIPQAVATPDQITQASPTSKAQQILPAPVPLTVPQITPPVGKSLPPAPPTASKKPSVQAIPGPIIPASPPLPRAAVPSAALSETAVPHTRYLPSPPAQSPSAAASVIPEDRPAGLDPDVPTNQTTALPTAIECASTGDSAQAGQLPETDNSAEPTPSAKNRDIEKSMENAERSLKGFRPF